MKGMTGVKFEFDDGAGGKIKLWHYFDKTPTEQLISRRTSALVADVKSHLFSTSKATVDNVKEFVGGDWDIGHVWLVDRSPPPLGAPPRTLGRPQNWPLARVCRGTETTYVRLPGVERVPSFTIELVDHWIADASAVEHGGGANASMDA